MGFLALLFTGLAYLVLFAIIVSVFCGIVFVFIELCIKIPNIPWWKLRVRKARVKPMIIFGSIKHIQIDSVAGEIKPTQV